jgi:hypothetical protein
MDPKKFVFLLNMVLLVLTTTANDQNKSIELGLDMYDAVSLADVWQSPPPPAENDKVHLLHHPHLRKQS